MKLAVCTIFDQKSGLFNQPFFTANVATAERAIENCIMDKEHPFSKHPEDYVLFDLGHYDDQTGMFVQHSAPVSITTLSQLSAKVMMNEKLNAMPLLTEVKENGTTS